MTSDTLAFDGSQKIRTVRDKALRVGFARALQVLVTFHATGIEHVVLAVATLALPVDRIEVIERLRPGIVHAEARLGDHVSDSAVVRQVTMSALGAHALLSGAAVNVVAITGDHGRHGVTPAAKFDIGGTGDDGLGHGPGGDREECCQHQQDEDAPGFPN